MLTFCPAPGRGGAADRVRLAARRPAAEESRKRPAPRGRWRGSWSLLLSVPTSASGAERDARGRSPGVDEPCRHAPELECQVLVRKLGPGFRRVNESNDLRMRAAAASRVACPRRRGPRPPRCGPSVPFCRRLAGVLLRYNAATRFRIPESTSCPHCDAPMPAEVSVCVACGRTGGGDHARYSRPQSELLRHPRVAAPGRRRTTSPGLSLSASPRTPASGSGRQSASPGASRRASGSGRGTSGGAIRSCGGPARGNRDRPALPVVQLLGRGGMGPCTASGTRS